MFIKFLRHDLYYGLVLQKAKAAITFIMFFFLSSYYYLTLRIYELTNPEYFQNPPTTGDYLVSLIGGCGKYTYVAGEADNLFNVPVMWTILVLWILFSTLYYPFSDLNGIGKHLMIISGSRNTWWFSKCVWTVATVIVQMFIVLLACTFSSALFGARLSMQANYYSLQDLDIVFTDIVHNNWNMWPHLLNFCTVLIALCLLQLLISLITKPFYSFLAVFAYCLSATYIQTPFLLGNYMMTARSSKVVIGGVNNADGIVISIWIIVLTVLIGANYFCRSDILNKDN